MYFCSQTRVRALARNNGGFKEIFIPRKQLNKMTQDTCNYILAVITLTVSENRLNVYEAVKSVQQLCPTNIAAKFKLT